MSTEAGQLHGDRSARRCNAAGTSCADAGDMTDRMHVIGAYVASVKIDLSAGGQDVNRVAGVAHAVARPTLNGLESAVCGALVTAVADKEWEAVSALTRCAECERGAG